MPTPHTEHPAATLLRTAIQNRTIRHGKHAARLLRDHGHTTLADRLDREVSARCGHLSARQAADLIESETA
ncbi:hypothetical protein ACWGIR_32045 [Streptomyces albidoflavus]